MVLRLLLWVPLAWLLPALVAGAAGWQGVWGSGSASVDYALPLPIAGGMLHLPSFLLATVLVARLPSLPALAAARARLGALGVAIAGALMVFEWPSGRVQQNPLGLFLLSDGALAFMVFALARQRPWLRIEPLSLLLLVAPAALLAWVVRSLEPGRDDFNLGTAQQDDSYSRTTVFVHTRLKPGSTKFEAAALDWAAGHVHPKQWGNVEDAAIHFVPQYGDASAGRTGAVFATLCQYEDGTPPRWLPPLGDCFAGRVTLAEQIRQATAAQPADLPREVREYLGTKAVCDVAPPLPPGPENPGITRVERCRYLGHVRDLLVKKFPGQVP